MAHSKLVNLDKAPAYRWWILIMNMLAYGVFFAALQAAYAFQGSLQQEFGLSATSLSFLTTGLMLTYALCAGLGAHLTNKFGARKAILIGLGIEVASSLLIPVFGGSYAGLLVLRVIQGVTGGILATPVVTSTAMWFPIRQRGLATGILMGVIGIGLSYVTFFAPRLLAAGLDWQWAMALVLVVPGAAIGLLYAFSVREIGKVYPGQLAIAELLQEDLPASMSAPDEIAKRPATLREAQRTFRFWALVLYGFNLAWLLYAFSVFLPPLLGADLGLDAAHATTILSLTFFVGFIGSPLGGVISDLVFKGQRYQVLMIGFSVTAVCLALVPFAPVSVLTVLLLLAYAGITFCIGPYWTIPSVFVQTGAVADLVGRLTLLVCIANFLVGPILALTIDLTGSAFLALYICVALAAVAVLMARAVRT